MTTLDEQDTSEASVHSGSAMPTTHKSWLDQREQDLEPYPNDLDGCAGIMFGALLSFIFFAGIVVLCLSAR